MPENKCARCGEADPVLFEAFRKREDLPDMATQLGFCGSECYYLFCAGIAALQIAI